MQLKRIDDYPAYLEEAWLEHIQPKADNAPTVISTFAGAGGSSLGYSMAGFKELLAVEWDNNAVETFKLNFHDVPVYHGDIAKLSVDEVLQITGLKPGELDVFDGSPPCQGFSTAGKQNFDDGRNQLFREYVRLLRGLKPKVFIMENVSGMVKGTMKLIFVEILRELKASGYKVSARLLNVMYFGVPQSRQRMIFVGVRGDFGIEPSHPSAETETVSSKEAIGELEGWEAKPLHTPKKIGDGAKSLERWHKVKHGEPVLGQSLYKIYPDRPCHTIKKSSEHYHYSEPRRLTGREYTRLGSFPDAFKFLSEGDSHVRVGNSVPPLFMRSIARHIRAEILGNCVKTE